MQFPQSSMIISRIRNKFVIIYIYSAVLVELVMKIWGCQEHTPRRAKSALHWCASPPENSNTATSACRTSMHPFLMVPFSVGRPPSPVKANVWELIFNFDLSFIMTSLRDHRSPDSRSRMCWSRGRECGPPPRRTRTWFATSSTRKLD